MATRSPNSGASRLAASHIRLEDVKPFLSAVLLEATLSDRALAEALIIEAASAVGVASRTATRTVLDGPCVSKRGDFYVGSTFYREASAPAWDVAHNYEDVRHHFAWVVVRGRRAALLASDAAMRETMRDCMTSAAVIERDVAYLAFVGNHARTVWLNGTHARTDVKADAKTLMGSALEEALDPLGDHSYHLSALRSNPAIANLGTSTLGVALTSGRVWSARPQSLPNLLGDIGALFDRLDNPPTTRIAKFDFLSQPIKDLTGVQHAYAVAVLPKELLDPAGTGAAAEVIARAQGWAYEARYAVTPGIGSEFSVAVHFQGTGLGELEVRPVTQGKPRRVTLDSGGWLPVDPALTALRDECQRYLLDAHQVKIHYDSGHAITDAQCFRGGFTDQLVTWEWRDFTGYDVEQEKPAAAPTLAAAVGSAADQSLFGFVVKERYSQGWLTCDDGAGEVGDFVHLDPVLNKVSLIHAKASSSADAARQVSVADFDIVVAQGIRNIRHLDQANLVAALQASAHHQIAAATWHNGRRATRADFVAAVQALGASFSKELVILQPRLTRTEYQACVNQTATPARRQRFQQLNALVLSARLAAINVGATFTAFACE
jgi:hypothetical protein